MLEEVLPRTDIEWKIKSSANKLFCSSASSNINHFSSLGHLNLFLKVNRFLVKALLGIY